MPDSPQPALHPERIRKTLKALRTGIEMEFADVRIYVTPAQEDTELEQSA